MSEINKIHSQITSGPFSLLIQALDEGDWSVVERYSVFITISHVWASLLCNVGDDVTNGFLQISEEIYDFDWHLLPLNQQKYIPTIIAIAQRPVYIQGLGNVRCTRETFKSVQFKLFHEMNWSISIDFILKHFFQIVNAGFSYFVVIRQSMELQMQDASLSTVQKL